MAESSLYLGLMSGTSLDGIDAVLAQFDHVGHPTFLARADQPLPCALRAELLALNTAGPDELERAARAANALAELSARAVKEVFNQANVTPKHVSAIGAHGQTVRHQPQHGFTIQLNAPALLAERTGVSVIADFRSRDVAAGGQGAPLVPLFHAGIFSTSHTRVILNLGGIANITILRPNQTPIGFDTGPANLLMDMWCARHTGAAFDHHGTWGAGGQCDTQLLGELLLSEPWFEQRAPKSTGRDLFNWNWLAKRLNLNVSARVSGLSEDSISAQHVQATLRMLTVETITQAIRRYAADAKEVLVCGGGARNLALMTDLKSNLVCNVRTTESEGIGTQDVEALAFAWLAWAFQRGIAVGNPVVTGAKGSRILGACWPA